MNEKYLIAAIIIVSFLAFTTIVFGQQEYNSIMNASIKQPICIQLSGNYSDGIFFTNTTTVGAQYPITDMSVWNNATGNYWGSSSGTVYYIQACPGNAVSVKVAHCACEDLLCSGGDCSTGVDRLYVQYIGGQGGVGWANGTTPTFGTHTPSQYFAGTDSFDYIAGNLTAGGSIYMRYWIDPRPNNAPSGIYNNTFKIRAVEITTSIGTCSC